MQIGDGVRDSKRGLEIEMQSAMAQWSKVHECGAVLNGLEGESQIHGDRSGATSALSVHDSENFSAGSFAARLATCGSQSHKRFQKIGRGSRPLDVLARPRPHSADDQLGLRQASNGEHGRIGKFLMQEFDGAQRRRDFFGGDVHQNHVGRKSLRLADDRIGGRQRQRLVTAHGARHAGSIHQDLEHCALVIVRGENCN